MINNAFIIHDFMLWMIFSVVITACQESECPEWNTASSHQDCDQ